MNDEGVASCRSHSAHKVAHEVVALNFVNANAVLDGDRNAHHIHHGFHTIGHQLRLGHQAGTKSAALHALAGAAAVQVDFVVAPLLAQPGGLGQISWLTAAQLQRQRVFFDVKAKMARHIAVNQRASGHHLGVQQRVLGQQAVKVATVPICPVHHGRN